MRGVLCLMMALAWALIIPLSASQAEPTLQQRYLEIYVKLHDAENLEKQGDYAGALKNFQECYEGFGAIRSEDPEWEPALVIHRLSDCKVTIDKLQETLAKTATTTSTVTGTQSTQATPPPAPPASDANPAGNLVFINSAQKPKTIYPWKTGIITTLFWIGQKTKMNNVWKLQVPKGASSDDSPEDRNGYASGTHASSFNPFYVALPFNDLAFPDRAKQWVPAEWQRPDKDGKPVSSCQHRWIEIKMEDGSGHLCYAQWEDVGPFHNDDAEYVLGPGKDGPSHGAGLTVSPAVAQYLSLGAGKGKNTTRWRFVDAEDVPPGAWLKYEEQAVIYTAMHQLKEVDASAKK